MSVVTAQVGTAIGLVRLAATEAGLCKIALGDETPESFETWLARHAGPAIPGPAAPALTSAAEQLTAYLEGRLEAFDLPLDLRGTPFQKTVWEAVAAVPFRAATRRSAGLTAKSSSIRSWPLAPNTSWPLATIATLRSKISVNTTAVITM